MHGTLVEDRVLPVDRVVRIGESGRAAVSFPGADIAVVRMGRWLSVRGRKLEEGDEVSIFLGPVEVEVAHTLRASLPSEWAGMFDERFLAAALLLMAVGTWSSALNHWLDSLPETSPKVVRQVQQALSVRSASAGAQAATLPSPPEGELAPEAEPALLPDGPRHRADDATTGVGWWAWYQNEVPADDQEDEALDRLLMNPDDAAARRVLARSAYDRDDYDAATWHYRWLLDRYPEDRDVRLRLARAERRRGYHAEEAALYRSLLEEDPANLDALSGLAVALVRLGRLDEAVVLQDKLQAAAPVSPLTELTIARIEAQLGHAHAALEALDRAIAEREQLSHEAQVELRRDLALDPAFAALRADRRMLSVVHRHLGAAGPRPAR